MAAREQVGSGSKTMALIYIKRAYTLPKEQARAKVDEFASRFADRFKVKHAWDGDIFRFKGGGASGVFALGDEVVYVKVKLGVHLAPMKTKIEQEIVAVLDEVQVKV